MNFYAVYVKDCPIEEIGDEEEKDFDASTWGHALAKAEMLCPKGFLLKFISRQDIE